MINLIILPIPHFKAVEQPVPLENTKFVTIRCKLPVTSIKLYANGNALVTSIGHSIADYAFAPQFAECSVPESGLTSVTIQ